MCLCEKYALKATGNNRKQIAHKTTDYQHQCAQKIRNRKPENTLGLTIARQKTP
jgi:hypothetical protein